MENNQQQNIPQTPSLRVSVPRETGEPKGVKRPLKAGVRLQSAVALCSFIAAIGFAIAGFITPPEGEVHDSILYLIAQFLLVTTSIFGVSAVVTHQRSPKGAADNSVGC